MRAYYEKSSIILEVRRAMLRVKRRKTHPIFTTIIMICNARKKKFPFHMTGSLASSIYMYGATHDKSVSKNHLINQKQKNDK